MFFLKTSESAISFNGSIEIAGIHCAGNLIGCSITLIHPDGQEVYITTEKTKFDIETWSKL